ncbi:hypothetical protein AVEN_230678-1 [Araneus ventricosus]|uniref:Uncharacterized protein n=1 Tax=Araneus ventricosus TaxID=182803 RepID=A0A4Y2A1I2_ARAVE|nr:hypothetical protein AVEN_230678-1 [Araneus ventricosus]
MFRDQQSLSKFQLWSVIIASGIPNLEIHPEKKASATVLSDLFCSGKASGRRVKRSTSIQRNEIADIVLKSTNDFFQQTIPYTDVRSRVRK